MDKTSHSRLRREERGVTMLTVLVALSAMIAAASLAIDVGLVYVARNQAQNLADSVALAAARKMIDKDIPAVTIGDANTAGMSVAGENSAIANASLAIASGDMVYGSWDLDTATFSTGVDLSDPTQVSAVEVTARLDGGTNNSVPAFLSRVLGRTEFDVSAMATAYLGFAGTFPPGEVDLPIAIDCCKLKGDSCDDDYCATIATPPNSCSLVENPQTSGSNTVSCIEFHNTSEQNACWTQFDGDSSSINSSDLTDIVEDGSAVEISVEDPIYVDNGSKTPVIGEINDKFLGQGSYTADGPAGDDYYLPKDGLPDSWIVRLPVVECQADAHCASGVPMRVVGGICFEIREVTVTPDKIIRGSFMCPSHPRWAECDLGLTGSGGIDFDIRADLPVLVR